VCLTEEDSGVLISSVFVVFTGVGGKGRKRGQWGLGKGTKNGTVDSERGVRSLQPSTKNHHSK
jgi:hypothetical protein